MRLLATALVLVASAAAQPADRAARLDSALAALHTDGLFAGALAIADSSGAVVYRWSAGTHEGEPVTTRTPLPLASVAKAMTAAAALSLAADDLLHLDGPVGDVVQPWPYPGVTVRQLANQTAGLHALTTLTAHRDTTRPVTTGDWLALMDAHRPGLSHPPGSAFEYDNAHYEVLATVVEAASRQTYAETMRSRVFGPAGMETAATGGPSEIPWADWNGGGGRYLLASAEDLLAFDAAFWSGQIVPDSLVRAALAPPALADGSTSPYVFGRFLTDDPRPLIGHFGDGGAVKTGLWRERDTRTAYAILATDDGLYRTPVLIAAMAIWNGEPFALPLPRPVAEVDEAVLARHVGVYASGMGRLHITLADGQLHLEPEGAGGSEPLVAGSETVFYFCCQDLTWEFVTDDAGQTVGLQLQGQPQTYAARVE